MAYRYLFQMVGCFVLTLTLAFPAYACKYIDLPSDYARHFRYSVKKHWHRDLHKNYELLVAQCYTESALNPRARSPVGALGICQIMPNTFKEEAKRAGLLKGSARRVQDNIRISAQYMARLMAAWTTPRDNECRIELAWASYNAGMGNILKAQKKANNALCWERIKYALPEVTGKHSRETINYVSRIWGHFRCLKGLRL